MAIPSQDQGSAEPQGQLCKAIAQLDGQLVPIEEILGVQEEAVVEKTLRQNDLPARLDSQIKEVNRITGRVCRIKNVVARLKENVG